MVNLPSQHHHFHLLISHSCCPTQISVNRNTVIGAYTYRRSSMSAHVLLNILNKLAEHFISFSSTSLINSIIQEHEC